MTEEFLRPQLSYWTEQLRDLPLIPIPTARVRTAAPTYSGERHPVVVPKNLSARLGTLARQEGVTLYVTLLASFQTLLFRLSGQLDIPVATALSHQDRPELKDLIGVFVSPVFLRTNFSGAASFSDILHRVRKRVLEAIANPDCSADRIERLYSSKPLERPYVSATFLLDPPIPKLNPGWSMDCMDLYNGIAPADLALQLIESADGVSGCIDYASDIFSAHDVEELAGKWLLLLEELVEHPENHPAGRS